MCQVVIWPFNGSKTVACFRFVDTYRRVYIAVERCCVNICLFLFSKKNENQDHQTSMRKG